MGYTEKKIRGERVYTGVIVKVELDDAELVDGTVVKREIVMHPGGVGILPVDADGTAYMVRQFRYPFSRELLEIPAGKLELGEDPRVCAERELGEETGFSAGRFIDLGVTYASPGISDEILHIYLALDLVPGKQHLDEDEFLGVEKWPLEKLYAMVLRGEIKDGKTEIAVMKAREILRNGG
jgi:ADP-ribose pyrophosphatase